MKQQLTSPRDKAAADIQNKPPLDQDSFQQLLAAAYVLQEHNDSLPGKDSTPDAARSLAEIVEIRDTIQAQQPDLQAASMLIAERILRITKASGAAVGIVQGDQLTCCGAAGSALPEAGSTIPVISSTSAACIRKDQVLRCFDVARDPDVNVKLCQERGVKSLIAVPVHHEGKVGGVLEVRFSQANGFQTHDVQTAQLMAALVSEAIHRAADMEWKQALATERALMLEALERIKPQIERLSVETPAAVPQAVSVPREAEADAEPKAVAPSETPETPAPANASDNSTELEEKPETACRNCGRQFRAEEFFCGSCGTARLTADSSSGDLQSKWASLWFKQQGAATEISESSDERSEFTASRMTDSDGPMPAALEEIASRFSHEAATAETSQTNDEINKESEAALPAAVTFAVKFDAEPCA